MKKTVLVSRFKLFDGDSTNFLMYIWHLEVILQKYSYSNCMLQHELQAD